MPSDSNISAYIEQIQEATYGQQVRGAICNALATCYNDVTSGVTTLETALEGVGEATDAASEAATAANNIAVAAQVAKDDFTTAKNMYDLAYSAGNSYVQQLETIKDNTEALYDLTVSEKNNAAQSASSALTSANNAKDYLDAIRTYNIDAMDDRLDALESAETIISGYMSTTKGYMEDAESAKNRSVQIEGLVNDNADAVGEIYDAITALNIPSLSGEISEIRDGLTRMDTLAETFSGYSNTFSGYSTTFSGYATTFSGYNTNFTNGVTAMNEALESIQDYTENVQNNRDEVASIKEEIDALNFEDIAANATSAIEEAQGSLTSIRAEVEAVESMELDQKMLALQEYYDNTVTYAERAENAVQDLSESIDAANTAANSANSKLNEMTILQANLTDIQNSWNNGLYSSIQSGLTAMSNAVSTAQSAVDQVTTTSETVNTLLSRVETVDSDWSSRKATMDAYLIDAATALTEVDTATQSIDNMSVTSESVSYVTPSSAEISDVDGHKNIHFRLTRGEPGPGNVIKGSVYSTLSDLQADITDPEVGDQYNVGTSTPYYIYRWTGSDWENEGPYGVSFERLVNDDIDDIYDTQLDVSGGKYLDTQGLVYYTRSKIFPSLDGKVDVVQGKALSTNDFTDEYKSKISSLETSVTVLQSNKVDVVAGKSLSTNDFTNAFKNQVTANATNIASLNSSKVDSDFESFKIFSGTEWTSGMFAVRYGSDMYQLSISRFIQSLTTLGNYVQNTQIASTEEALEYLGL